jgi:two-component system, sensor histidine kinase and response regulator
MANVQPAGFCAALLARVGGDQEVFSELCDIFLDDAPKRLATIRASIESGDCAGVRAAAHAFKGAAGVFDADEVVDAARRLEQMGETGSLQGSEDALANLEAFSRVLIEEIRNGREG